jgi:hypothetical protein
MMHVYLRWYANGQPDGSPQRMEDEYVAKEAVLARFPDASFSERVEALYQPHGNVSGIDSMLYAWPGPRTSGVPPIADILFPEP